MLYNKKILEVSKLLLFLLILSINLREPFFHSREILFIVFIFFSIRYGNYKKLFYMLLFLTIWGGSITYNILIPGSDAIKGVWFQGVIVSGYLFLMIFSNKKYYDVIIQAFLFSSLLVAILTIVLYFLCWFFPPIRNALVLYFGYLYEKSNLTFVNIGSRMIVGHEYFFVWYRTSPIMIPALGFCCIQDLKKIQLKWHRVRICLYMFALMISGTRANMLSAILLFFFYMVFKFLMKKKFHIAFLILLISIIVGLYMASSFLLDRGSISTNIKNLDQLAYFKTFNSDIIRAAFWGWGYGSTFFSLGRNTFVDITELSLLETIRRYGFLGMITIMTFIWLKPLIKKMVKENFIIKYYYILVVLAYISVACTNPYLIDSLGFCVLLFFDSFFEWENLV